MYEGEGQGSQDGGTTAERDDMYSGLSDGEIEEPDAYSDISSDENFLDSLNDDQRMVRVMTSLQRDAILHPHACIIIYLYVEGGASRY